MPDMLVTLQVQAALQTLAEHRWIREMLQPPHTRSFMGCWLLASELLLKSLPSDDQPKAVQSVGPAWCHKPC